LSETGAELASIETEWCASAHEGLAAFSPEAVGFGKQGYNDASGAVAIAPMFDAAADFSEGLAMVSVRRFVGVIDKSGDWMINANRFDFIGAFENGLAPDRSNGR